MYNGDDLVWLQFLAILNYSWKVKHEEVNSTTSTGGDAYGWL